MRNQFFYDRTEVVKSTVEGEKPTIKIYRESFNINKVIRNIHLDDGRTLILLDDIHERVQSMPKINPKTNKVVGYDRKRETFQTEVFLNEKDTKKFEKLTAIKE